MRITTAALLLAACTGAPSTPAPSPPSAAEPAGPPAGSFTLVFSSQLEGELEPCG